MARKDMSRDDSLLNNYRYEDLSSLKKAIQNMLRFQARSISKGSYSALILLVDLKTGLGLYKGQVEILTKKQMESVKLCLILDYTESEAAKQLGVTQQTIHYSIQGALKRVQYYLLTGGKMPDDTSFSKEETVDLIDLYTKGHKPKELSRIMDKDLRTIRNKLKVLKMKGRIPMGEEGE